MVRRRRLHAVYCAALLSALTGCLGRLELGPVVQRRAPLVTELISAGQDPKATLRFQVAEGDEQHVVLKADVGVQNTTRFADGPYGGGLPISWPREVMRYEQEWLVKVTDVAESGDISFDLSIEKAALVSGGETTSKDAQDMQRWVRSRVGRWARIVMSNRGVPKSSSDIRNGGLLPAEQIVLEAMESYLPFVAIPFPEAPIGVGAKWSATRSVESQGSSMVYVAHYELTEFENGSGTVKTNVERSTRPFHRRPSGDRAGNRYDRRAMTTTGTHEFSLERILPKSENLESRCETHMVIEFPNSNMVVLTVVDAAQEMTMQKPVPKAN